MKNRTFKDYWRNSKWLYKAHAGYFVTNEGMGQIEKMCRNAYNAGLREGKKKRPRAVKP